MTIIDTLKQKVKDSEQLVKDTRMMYDEMRAEVKAKERELKAAKSYFNRSHKNWVHAKKLVIKNKARLSRYPWSRRKWAKEHMGEVFRLIEDTHKIPLKDHFCQGKKDEFSVLCAECKEEQKGDVKGND